MNVTVTVTLEEFEAESICACGMVGAEGCPDEEMSEAAVDAITKIKQALDG